MNELKTYIGRNEGAIHGLFWILYFTSVNVNWSADWFDPSFRPGRPAPLSVLIFPILFYANTLWLIPKYFRKGLYLKYALSFCLVFLLPELVRAFLLDPYGLPLSERFFTRDSFVFGSPSVVWYALFSSFAYRLTKDWWINNRRINELEKEKAKQELALLKRQFDPHFLFNNLNIIDGLIEEDGERASKALHSLAKLYQYLLATSGKDLVPVSEEYEFISNYIYLLSERFPKAYNFDLDDSLKGIKEFGLPPGALQVLVENAVKHNAGSTTSPLQISIKLDREEVIVENSIRLKKQSITGHGQGLKGLQKRYLLLGDKKVNVERGDTFLVRLPLIPLPQ